MMNTENLIVVGKLGSSYGIRGWIRIFSFTEIPDSIFDYTPWYIQRAGQWQEIIVESFKPHNQDMIVKLKGIDDRDQANALTNAEVFVDAEKLPALSNGDFYWKDLIGCRVKTVNGYDLGLVTDLMETGSNDVLVVKANLKDAFGTTERLIPFVEDQFIKQVDLTTKTVLVDWDPAF
ncbi:ribosome maturation factor RimM [Gilliamella sp. Pra-s65]|uniref:ribosome maturation factor RimM n=2 Tax=unclassified Gilliamella TaxID=2685620 RepID=UPI001329E00A|nr:MULTISPECIES: ribosome maturation factor RimM [unclassified Gilliamella]MWN31442.1 ribosome maturation factor RimM [Gilliamella sp. Pra-s60]MWP29715.1 ribosome maturation factor RimM [Gilliamella sp. Pra-s54]MWN90363.1 ribosome maturation factor RimM [Gilliamella sp. Pra-s65]MWP46653.1 ribosome maturation factor RimM [Gilliamella sp. Pas-s27]MWP73365.1 ribosome maturation factor RimM [Gilliamella sp. Pra-s52]